MHYGCCITHSFSSEALKHQEGQRQYSDSDIEKKHGDVNSHRRIARNWFHLITLVKKGAYGLEATPIAFPSSLLDDAHKEG